VSAKPWYAWFPGDYRAKTAHLTFLQDSAYRRLLDAYYERRGPLPADITGLCRIAGAQSAEERRAIAEMSKAFFENGDGLLHHSRCDEQLAKEEELHRKWAEAGRKGGLSQAQARLKPASSIGPLKPGSSIPSPHPHSYPNPQDLSGAELSQRGTPSAPSDFSDSSDPTPSDSPVALIPLVGSKSYPVSAAFLAELEAAYPAVDGPATLREIRAWCVANPTKRKTARGATRFINRWFEKVQNG
jgi:uncharacterized protein YdaU (DUF1376 family)